MAHQGSEFATLVDNDPRTVIEIAKEMGVGRQTIYDLIKVETFSPNQLAKIAKSGLKLTGVPDPPRRYARSLDSQSRRRRRATGRGSA